ncbi:MAG TPA: hypothetical protein VE645_17370 [Pseudonocardiaceae bacterium]|nr:hypothetical protein [Pseudonocardiaceae bacterium]
MFLREEVIAADCDISGDGARIVIANAGTSRTGLRYREGCRR